MSNSVRLTAVGGPTVAIEYAGLRFLTDPTFDPPTEFPFGPTVLRKTAGPAVPAAAVGPIDAVLLSHDQHPDNLDDAGRAVLARAGRVFTTPAGAARLGGAAVGLEPWAAADLPAAAGPVRVTAAPARHGPAGCEPLTGDVTGFVLTAPGRPAVYVSGDTVWYEGVAEVARRFDVRLAVLFLGAARVPELGDAHFTMDTADAVAAARAFPNAVVVPAHVHGWAHFSEGQADVERAFAAAGLAARLRWLPPGVPTDVAIA